MAQIELRLPKMGESVAEATIIKWLVEEGQEVEMDDPLVEIATDKVDSEVPSPEDGVVLKMMVQEGDVVQVGDVIAVIGTEGESGDAISTPAQESVVKPVIQAPVQEEVVAELSAPLQNGIEKSGSNGSFYSPLVRKIAETEGISMVELENIPGTGKEGRVTKTDILTFVDDKSNGKITTPITSETPTTPVVKVKSTSSPKTEVKPYKVGPNEEIIEMDRMRKLIADHMVKSVATSPHVTSFVEADVTNLVLWRNKVKNDFLAKEGGKLTFTPIFLEAVAKAIKDFPMINVSVDGTNIIVKKDINIGMAAALPSGNLIVPVIRNADQLNLVGLAKKVNDLAERARTNKLTPDEISGGTYTISNVGTFGNVMGTPIINQPQAAIMALGAIRKKPAVIETPQGDAIAVRHMMFLSHSYDHRIVDGMLGGTFVRRVADYLENFDINRKI